MTYIPRPPQDKGASPASGSVHGKPPAGTVSREPAGVNQKRAPE